MPYRAASGLGLKPVPATSCGCGQRQAAPSLPKPGPHLLAGYQGGVTCAAKHRHAAAPDSPKPGADHAATRLCAAHSTAVRCGVPPAHPRFLLAASGYQKSPAPLRATAHGERDRRSPRHPHCHCATQQHVHQSATAPPSPHPLSTQPAAKHLATCRHLPLFAPPPHGDRAGQTPERGVGGR